MLDILTSYTFKVVFAGTLLLSISSALVGALNLYKGQSLIGDAIGHSTFPGITLAFILFQSRNPLILLLGACISGGIAYYIIQKIKKTSIIELDASLAIVLSGFFGLVWYVKVIYKEIKALQEPAKPALKNIFLDKLHTY